MLQLWARWKKGSELPVLLSACSEYDAAMSAWTSKPVSYRIALPFEVRDRKRFLGATQGGYAMEVSGLSNGCGSWECDSAIARPSAWNSLARSLGSVALAMSLGGVTLAQSAP